MFLTTRINLYGLSCSSLRLFVLDDDAVCFEVGRAFSFNKTPNSQLKRAVSSMISPMGPTTSSATLRQGEGRLSLCSTAVHPDPHRFAFIFTSWIRIQEGKIKK